MWRYPDGSFKKNVPNKRVELNGQMFKFDDLTTVQKDSIGYNEAIPINKDKYCTYTTEWNKDEDLIYRESIISTDFDSSDAINNLKSLVNKRRAKIKCGGVLYTLTTQKEYQTGTIPNDVGCTYEQNYFALAAVGEGGTIRAADNTSDVFNSAKIVELCNRIVAFSNAIQSSCDTLDAAAEAVTDNTSYQTVVDRINGTADWPTTPYPES